VNDSGVFTSLENFLTCCGGLLNKKILDSLTRSGALDLFAPRSKLFGAVDLMVKYAASAKNLMASQASLFSDEPQNLDKISLPNTEFSSSELLKWEKELLGFYLSDHPLKSYQTRLGPQFIQIASLSGNHLNEVIRLAVNVRQVKKITTRSGSPMAFVQVEDLTGAIEAVVFPSVWETYRDAWQSDKLIIIDGRVSDKDNSLKLIVDKVYPLDDDHLSTIEPIEQANKTKRNSFANPSKVERLTKPALTDDRNHNWFVVELPARISRQKLEDVRTILMKYPGEVPVELRINNSNNLKIIPTKISVNPSVHLERAIKEVTS